MKKLACIMTQGIKGVLADHKINNKCNVRASLDVEPLIITWMPSRETKYDGTIYSWSSP